MGPAKKVTLFEFYQSDSVAKQKPQWARSRKKECILDLSKVRSGCSLASNGSYLLSQLAPACPGIWASNPTQ